MPMPASFDDFVDQRLPAVLRFTGVLTGDRHLAEDVVQEVLVKAHRHWATIAVKQRPESYVKRMVVNEYVSWLRKWGRVVPWEDMREHSPDLVPDFADHVADRAEVADRLSQLPARQRAVIVLRYYEGLSDVEIASVLGCRAGTVRGYAARALATLRLNISQANSLEFVTTNGRISRD